MTKRPETPNTLRFDRFELQPHERRLLVAGQVAPLGARAFDLLLVLATRAGQLVTKNELLDAVWPGLVVEEANLSVQVSALRKVLGGELIATIPGRGYRFTARVQAVDAGPAASPPAPPPAPPATTARAFEPPANTPALIGRQAEWAELRQALGSPGCVTLLGPAGVGKTTLARAVASAWPAGTVWVDLAGLTAGSQLWAAVARALGTEPPQADPAPALRARLGARLLVLDNAEHVVHATAEVVSQLLAADPGLGVLVTSQARLAVSGERVHRLEPLALPVGSDTLDLQRGAVALFVERARAADHRFDATAAQLPLLREICRRLDGLPLALEMAAARVRVLGLRGLADGLERRLALLTSGQRDAADRHRTLQAALDWSHGLLSGEEQCLYRACGVFTGGFTLDLLVAVATEPHSPGADERRWAVIESLSQLVDRSLVAVGDGDPPRYRLLETQREDARQRLAAAGEEARVRARLLAALAGLAQRCLEADRAGPELRDAILAEHDNLREAIAWGLLQADAQLRADTVTVATAAAFAACFTTWRLEAMQWLESCEPLAEGPGMPPARRIRWWFERSRQWLVSKHHGARGMAERTLALAREHGDELSQFNALSVLVRAPGGHADELPALCGAMRELLARHPDWGPARALSLAGAEARACDHLGDHAGLLRCRLRELELARQLGDELAVTGVETNVVFALQALGRHDEALARARDLVARLGDARVGNAAYAWTGLIVSLQALGHFTEFRAVLPRAAQVLRQHDLPLLEPQCALVLAAEGRTADALHALGHVRARFAAKGMALTADEASGLAAFEARARARLGDAAVDLCLAEGATLDPAAVEALMLAPPVAADSVRAG